MGPSVSKVLTQEVEDSHSTCLKWAVSRNERRQAVRARNLVLRAGAGLRWGKPGVRLWLADARVQICPIQPQRPPVLTGLGGSRVCRVEETR